MRFPGLIVRWIFRLAVVLVVLFALGGIFVVRQINLWTGMRGQVEEALSRYGAEVGIEKLVFDPFRGFVAEDIALEWPAFGTVVSARLSEAVFALNLRALVGGKVEIDSAAVRGAHLAFPVQDNAGVRRAIDLSNLRAAIVFLPGRLRLSEANFIFGGLRVTLVGSFLTPAPGETLPRRQRAPSSKAVQEAIEQFSDFFQQAKFSGRKAMLYVDLSGDLREKRAIQSAALQLRIPRADFRSVSLRNVFVQGTYSPGVLRFARIEASDEQGVFRASMDWDIERELLTFDLLSTLDLQPFADWTDNRGKGAFELMEIGGASISAQGTLTMGPKVSPQLILGKAAIRRLDLKGGRIEDLQSNFAAKAKNLFLSGLSLKIGSGTVSADFLLEESAFRLRTKANIKPTEIQDFLGPNERRVLEKMEFAGVPELTFEGSGDIRHPQDLSGSGRVALGRTAMNGAWMESAKANLRVKDRAFTYSDLEVIGQEGRATGSLTYDIARRELRVPQIRSTLPPRDAVMWIDPKIWDAIKPYRFRKPPVVEARGAADLDDPLKSEFDLEVRSDDGLTYNLIGKDLPFGSTRGSLRIRGRELKAKVPKAALFSGNVSLTADVSLDIARPGYSAEVDVEKLDFASVTRTYFNYQRSQGKLSGTYRFRVPNGKVESMQGTGRVSVVDGNVFAIPFLGPLSEILNQIIPGAGYQDAREATASFTLRDGTLQTKDMEVLGWGFTMQGEGDFYYLKDQMDFSVRINARGVPGVLLFPVSKAFEYVSDGKMSDPKWRPKLIPKGFPLGG